MGLFEKIFKHDRESEKALQKYTVFTELNGYKPVFRSWGGEIYESELVRSAIDARARHCGKLQPTFFGSARPSLQNKMKHAPNEWQTWYQFFYRASTILDVKNTCVIVPVFDEWLNVTGYYPVMPNKCEIIEYKNEPWIRYDFGQGKKAAVELRMCAVLTKYQYKDDFFGESNKALGETMKLIDINRQGIEQAVQNSASYSFIAQADNFTDPDDLELERKRFSAKNLSKDAEGGGLLLFPSTYQNIQQVKFSPFTVDAEQLSLIQKNVELYFGVNEKVMMNEANGDELDAFYNGAVEPFAIQISEAMTRAMFSLRERSNGAKFQTNANRLQYMSTTAKISMAQQLMDRGVLTINEARVLFNYPEVEGGDVRAIRGEFKNADKLMTTEGEEVVTIKEPEGGNEDADQPEPEGVSVDDDGTE